MFKTIGGYTENTDMISKTFKKNIHLVTLPFNKTLICNEARRTENVFMFLRNHGEIYDPNSIFKSQFSLFSFPKP